MTNIHVFENGKHLFGPLLFEVPLEVNTLSSNGASLLAIVGRSEAEEMAREFLFS